MTFNRQEFSSTKLLSSTAPLISIPWSHRGKENRPQCEFRLSSSNWEASGFGFFPQYGQETRPLISTDSFMASLSPLTMRRPEPYLVPVRGQCVFPINHWYIFHNGTKVVQLFRKCKSVMKKVSRQLWRTGWDRNLDTSLWRERCQAWMRCTVTSSTFWHSGYLGRSVKVGSTDCHIRTFLLARGTGECGGSD
jgi:hypothetical protein